MRGRAAALYTSEGVAQLSRGMSRFGRALLLKKRRITLWHRVDDPQSHLMAMALLPLAEAQSLDVEVVLVPAPAADVDPEPVLRAKLDREDAKLVAASLGFDFPPCDAPVVETRVRLANAILLVPRAGLKELALALEVGDALFRGDGARLQAIADREGSIPGHEVRPRLEHAYHRLRREGHYQAAVVTLDGEHFQGAFRLSHVRERLGQKVETVAPVVAAPTKITLFFSFRSPYSYLALVRLLRLRETGPLEITLRPVLPLVMRGLPVPSSKRTYIVRDAAREARRHGIPFGHICDPVGVGVERCLALYVYAESEGKGLVLAEHVARAIWSEAVDFTEDASIAKAAVSVGLDAAAALEACRDERFREIVERNREALYDLGHWGVPVLQVGELAVWGQDHIDLLFAASHAR